MPHEPKPLPTGNKLEDRQMYQDFFKYFQKNDTENLCKLILQICITTDNVE